MNRRIFGKTTLAAAVVAAAAGGGLLRPLAVLAADWPRRAFEAGDATAVRAALFGSREAERNRAVQLRAPEQATGDSVAVEVRADMDGVERIALVAPGNPQPLCAVAHTPHAAGYFSSRVRMVASGDLIAYVQTGSNLFFTSASVKISVGGYGMGKNAG
jgi:sulfur-oxidizing protein SoxY